MKYMVLVLLFMISNTFAAERLSLSLNSSEFRQGALVKGTLKLGPSQVNIAVPKLKGQSFGETLYFHLVSPLLRKENSDSFESEVQVIFIKVPESTSLSGKIGNDEVVIEWNPVTIIPVETPEKMLWAEFTAPDYIVRNWYWLLLIPVLALLAFFGIRVSNKMTKRGKLREKRRLLAEEFKNCRSYDDVVGLWKRKQSYLKEFPVLEEPFRKFETVLFKYQFKQTQTEDEKAIVLKAYQDLLMESEGGLRGV